MLLPPELRQSTWTQAKTSPPGSLSHQHSHIYSQTCPVHHIAISVHLCHSQTPALPPPKKKKKNQLRLVQDYQTSPDLSKPPPPPTHTHTSKTLLHTQTYPTPAPNKHTCYHPPHTHTHQERHTCPALPSNNQTCLTLPVHSLPPNTHTHTHTHTQKKKKHAVKQPPIINALHRIYSAAFSNSLSAKTEVICCPTPPPKITNKQTSKYK